MAEPKTHEELNLQEIGRQMVTQSNRGTQYPIFVVQQLVRTYHEGGEKRERLDEPPEGSVCADCSKAMSSRDDTPNPDCDACDISAFSYFDEEYRTVDNCGMFLTEQACHEHILQNAYHYTMPRSFVVSAWRNPEMVAVMQHLIKASGCELPSHYK